METVLKNNIDKIVPKVFKKKNMFVCIVDGKPGVGKSTLVSQLAYYCSGKRLHLDDFAFNLDQFSNILIKCKVGQSNILDEAFELNVRTTMSQANYRILNILQRVRSRSPFVFIIIPCMYDLDKNIPLTIADMFIHCYAKQWGERGDYYVYNTNAMKKLYLYGKPTRSYSFKISPPNFHGTFSSLFTVNEEEYEKRKEKALAQFEKGLVRKESNKTLWQRNALLYFCHKNGYKMTELGKIIETTQQSVSAGIKSYKTSKDKKPSA